MDTKLKKNTSENIKKTVSEMVHRREYEQKRRDESFSYKIKADTKEKTVIFKNFNDGSMFVSLI